MPRAFALTLINFYQRYLRGLMPACCRFVPSCSDYTKEAILKYGLAQGVFKGIKRILRCQPLSCRHGYDPLI